MWTVIKIQKNNIEILKNTFLKKLGKETKFYIPKVKMQFYKNNSLTFKELNLLGDYIFCYNQKLEDKNQNYIPDSWEENFSWFFSMKGLIMFVLGLVLGYTIHGFI